MKSKIVWSVAVLALLAGNVYLGLSYVGLSKELDGMKIVVASQRYNDMTLNFMKMFVKKVIKSDTAVDFETRLKLENSVRELGDPQILEQWQKFVNSATEVDAQKNVKELLNVLVDKIYIK